MSLPVILTDRAIQDLDECVRYLSENWSNQVKVDFLIKLENKFEQVSEMPYSNPVFELHPPLRRALVNRQIAFFYLIEENQIRVARIRSTRQNPDAFDLDFPTP